jgi:hypothetical protein
MNLNRIFATLTLVGCTLTALSPVRMWCSAEFAAERGVSSPDAPDLPNRRIISIPAFPVIAGLALGAGSVVMLRKKEPNLAARFFGKIMGGWSAIILVTSFSPILFPSFDRSCAHLKFTLLNEEFRYAHACNSLNSLLTGQYRQNNSNAGLAHGLSARPRVFVIDVGPAAKVKLPVLTGSDPRVSDLAEKVAFLLCTCRPRDEVVLRITSPGGAVETMGALASEVTRWYC